MKKLGIVIGIVIAICGIGLACILFAASTRSVSSGPQIYDLTDGKYDKIAAPKALPFGGWNVDDPGPVRIDMPYGIAISGTPTSLNFDETAVGRGLTYYGAGERFSDGYQTALNYCKQYKIEPKKITYWHDHGKGQDRFPAAWDATDDSAKVQVIVDISKLLPDPDAFIVIVTFGWPKVFNKANTDPTSKPSSDGGIP